MKQNEVGKRLRDLRGNKTIREVSEATGIGLTALSNYETGYRIPRDETKAVLADYYGVNLEELFFSQYPTKRREQESVSA